MVPLLTTVTGRVSKMCPYRDEADHGTVTFTWTGNASELHWLADFLKSFAGERVSHEEFTRRCVRATKADVTSTWTTAGLEITCFASHRGV